MTEFSNIRHYTGTSFVPSHQDKSVHDEGRITLYSIFQAAIYETKWCKKPLGQILYVIHLLLISVEHDEGGYVSNEYSS